MAKDKVIEIWNGLPTWAKGVVAVGGLAIIYFTSRSIVKAIKGSESVRLQKQTVTEVKSDIRDLEKKGIKPNYPDSQYQMWANAIKSHFEGCDPLNTAIDTVKDVFNGLKNNADFAKLVSAWGTKTYDQCGWFMGDVTGDLVYAIRDELDSDEISTLNKILERKGITYRV